MDRSAPHPNTAEVAPANSDRRILALDSVRDCQVSANSYTFDLPQAVWDYRVCAVVKARLPRALLHGIPDGTRMTSAVHFTQENGYILTDEIVLDPDDFEANSLSNREGVFHALTEARIVDSEHLLSSLVIINNDACTAITLQPTPLHNLKYRMYYNAGAACLLRLPPDRDFLHIDQPRPIPLYVAPTLNPTLLLTSPEVSGGERGNNDYLLFVSEASCSVVYEVGDVTSVAIDAGNGTFVAVNYSGIQARPRMSVYIRSGLDLQSALSCLDSEGRPHRILLDIALQKARTAT